MSDGKFRIPFQLVKPAGKARGVVPPVHQLGVALLLALDKRFNLRWGKMFGAYLIYYSIGRIWTESIRIDPSEVIAGLRVNIWAAIAGIVIGLVVIVLQTRRHPGLEESVFRAGFVPKLDKTDKVGTEN